MIMRTQSENQRISILIKTAFTVKRLTHSTTKDGKIVRIIELGDKGLDGTCM